MGVVFSQAAAKRISAAVKKVEAMKPERSGRQPQSAPTEGEIWGYLTGCDISGARHSFVRIIPDASSDSPDLMVEGGLKFRFFDADPLHIHTAYEVNQAKGIPSGTITRLTFGGFNADGDAVFMFQYQQSQVVQGGPLPIHDHRDNLNGGFAFAVFHPGTQLAQQNWAI